MCKGEAVIQWSLLYSHASVREEITIREGDTGCLLYNALCTMPFVQVVISVGEVK